MSNDTKDDISQQKNSVGCAILALVVISTIIWLTSAPPKEMTKEEINQINTEKLEQLVSLEGKIRQLSKNCDNEYQIASDYLQKLDFNNAAVSFDVANTACLNTSKELGKLKSPLYDTNYDKKIEDALKSYSLAYLAKANTSSTFKKFSTNKDRTKGSMINNSLETYTKSLVFASEIFIEVKNDLKSKMGN